MSINDRPDRRDRVAVDNEREVTKSVGRIGVTIVGSAASEVADLFSSVAKRAGFAFCNSSDTKASESGSWLKFVLGRKGHPSI